jgi:restriction system protein
VVRPRLPVLRTLRFSSQRDATTQSLKRVVGGITRSSRTFGHSSRGAAFAGCGGVDGTRFIEDHLGELSSRLVCHFLIAVHRRITRCRRRSVTARPQIGRTFAHSEPNKTSSVSSHSSCYIPLTLVWKAVPSGPPLMRICNSWRISLSLLAAVVAGCLIALDASSSSVAEIKIAAEQGDAEAQEKLGDAHTARMDVTQAELWYRKAAQAGRPTAQAKLGNRLLMRSRMGIGLDATTREKLGKEALVWIRPAARQGVARAQADLASILYDGKLAPQNLVEAFMWGALAAENPMNLVARTAGRTIRDAAVLKMTADQIREAQRRLAAFKTETAPQGGRPAVGLANQIQSKGITSAQPIRLASTNTKGLPQRASGLTNLPNSVGRMVAPPLVIALTGAAAVVGLIAGVLIGRLVPVRRNLGEALVAEALSGLMRPHVLLNNVTLPTADGTTQIDHILVADTGIFIIETKHYSGWIFGKPSDELWTQTIFRKRSRFRNPLRQNYGHVRTIQSLFNLPEKVFHGLVVFTGNAELKTDLGSHVLQLGELLDFLNREREVVLDERKMAFVVGRLEMKRHRRSLETDEYHLNYVRSKLARSRPELIERRVRLYM